MLEWMVLLWRNEEGLTTVEYALLLALVITVGIVTWTTFGATVRARMSSNANALNAVS